MSNKIIHFPVRFAAITLVVVALLWHVCIPIGFGKDWAYSTPLVAFFWCSGAIICGVGAMILVWIHFRSGRVYPAFVTLASLVSLSPLFRLIWTLSP